MRFFPIPLALPLFPCLIHHLSLSHSLTLSPSPLFVRFSHQLYLSHLFKMSKVLQRFYGQCVSLGGGFHFLYNSRPSLSCKLFHSLHNLCPSFVFLCLSHLTSSFSGLSLLFHTEFSFLLFFLHSLAQVLHFKSLIHSTIAVFFNFTLPHNTSPTLLACFIHTAFFFDVI